MEELLKEFTRSRDFAAACILAKRQENDPTWAVYVEIFDSEEELPEKWRIIGPRSTHAEWTYNPGEGIIRQIPRMGDNDWQGLLEVCGGDKAPDEALARELFIYEEGFSSLQNEFLERENTFTNPNMHGIEEVRRGQGKPRGRKGGRKPANGEQKMINRSLDFPQSMLTRLDEEAQQRSVSFAQVVRERIEKSWLFGG